MNASANVSCIQTADFQFYLFPTVYSLVLVLGLLGNLGALYKFIFRISPKNSANVYFINLALADTAFLCTLPFRIHYHLNGNHWVFGDLACRITGTLFFANIYISIAFLTCICLERYVATVHPHRYLRLQCSSCALQVSLAIWTVIGVAVVAFIVMGPLDSLPGSDGLGSQSCFENFSKQEWDGRMTAFSAGSLIFGSLLPFAVITICYPVVARRIAQIHTCTGQRALRVIGVIMAITVLCFLPYHAVHLLHLLMRRDIIQHCPYAVAIYQARPATMALVSVHSCLDPVLYYFSSSHCRWSVCRRLRSQRAMAVTSVC